MKDELIRACRKHDIRKVIELMITYFNGRDFTWCGVCNNVVDFNQDAIDDENLQIRIEKYLETMCEFDEISTKVNNILHKIGEDVDEVIDKLKSQGYDAREIDYDYTFNWDNDLSKDIQYHLLSIDGEFYVCIEVHCSGDARIGFSEMVCFKLTDYDYFHMGQFLDGYIDNETDFQGSYDIEQNCTYDKERKVWLHDGMEVRLYSLANGF